MRRIVALCLLFCFLIPSLFACGKKSPSKNQTDAAGSDAPYGGIASAASDTTTADGGGEGGTASSETAPSGGETSATADPWEPVAAAFARLDEKDRTILIELDESETEGTGTRNPRLFAGPDEIGGNTPAAEKAVYERNRAAETRLGISVGYAYWNDACGEQAERIGTLLFGGADDAPDLFVNALGDLSRAVLLGCFRNVLTPTGSYLDFTTDGWLYAFIGSLSLSRDRAYILAGDAFPDLYRGAAVLPFNLSMLDDKTFSGRLSSVICPNGTLAGSEKLSDRFFDLVEAGKWTYATLAALSAAVWLDCGTVAEQDDFNDVLGFVCDNAAGTAAGAFFAGCGTDYLLETTDGATGRVSLSYLPDGGSLGAVFDALSALTEGKGTVVTAGGYDDAPDNPGLAARRKKFAEGSLLFAGAISLGALAHNDYRTMTDEYAVAPLPVLREGDRYVSFVSPDADAGAVNRFSDVFPAVSAYLQFCAENSRDAVDAYLADLTKTDGKSNAGTSLALRIIRGSLVSARGEMIDAAVSGGGAPAWRALIGASDYRMTASDFAEEYPALAVVKQERLNRLLDEWYALPEGETE